MGKTLKTLEIGMYLQHGGFLHTNQISSGEKIFNETFYSRESSSYNKGINLTYALGIKLIEKDISKCIISPMENEKERIFAAPKKEMELLSNRIKDIYSFVDKQINIQINDEAYEL